MSKDQELLAKEYGFSDASKKQNNLISVNETRAMHEVQAAFVIAKKFPRDEFAAFQKVMKACERPFLAEQSMYAYPRGGKVVQGPSIRMAEVLLACWGNCDAGVKEVSQSDGVSIAEAYAVDLETNTRITKIFHVPHLRTSKNKKDGSLLTTKLTDPRDIYEMVANQGARRMRACILGIIPGDLTDAAIDECKKTLLKGTEPLADRIRKLVLAFDEIGIKIHHLQKRLGHNLDSIIDQEVITLRSIYKSIKDGMAKREDFFEMGEASSAAKSVDDIIADKKKTLLKKVDKEVYESHIEEDLKTGELKDQSRPPLSTDPETEAFLKGFDGDTGEINS